MISLERALFIDCNSRRGSGLQPAKLLEPDVGNLTVQVSVWHGFVSQGDAYKSEIAASSLLQRFVHLITLNRLSFQFIHFSCKMHKRVAV
jgi:hypothetical protein